MEKQSSLISSGRDPKMAACVLCALMCLFAVRCQAAEPLAADSSQQQIRRLVGQLGDKDYYIRQRAETELEKFGFDAFDALSEATASDDLEVASRARHLLQLMRVEWSDKNDPPEIKRQLRDYEAQNAEGRQTKMRALAALSNDAGVPALCRLVRYEKSALLSKQAAIEILDNRKSGGSPRKELAEKIRKVLGGSKRAAAVWLLTWLRFDEDPQAVTTDWTRLVDTEESLLRSSPGQTSPEMIAALLRMQVAQLKKAGRNEEAVAAIRRLIQLETGDAETLAALLQWLVEQKAWKAVDELAERFRTQIDANPVLLYALAEARIIQDRKDLAEETAGRALKHNPGKEEEALIAHYLTAGTLRQRGLFTWAKREFQHVVNNSPAPNDRAALAALFSLSEMQHDQGEDREAAEALQKIVAALETNQPATQLATGHRLSEIRAQMNYFFACHYEAKGEHAKYREYLDKALAVNAADLDVLIACYHLPDPSPEYRQKIRGLIEKAAADLHAKVAEEPDSAAYNNQFAWLVGNTEGDLDEALRCSQKSVDLMPEAGGYYDTLAHVYATKGDYANAVKTQTRAAELDPHSGQIKRKLELFRKKLAEQNKDENDRRQRR